MEPGTAKTLRTIIDAALCGELDEAQARKLHELGPEAVALAMLSACRRIAELESKSGNAQPSTPSGMVPIYAKANKSKPQKTRCPARASRHSP